MEITNAKILEAQAKLKEAQNQYASVVLNEQSYCPHTDVGEAEEPHNEYASNTRIRRVCLGCGLEKRKPY